MTVPSALEVAKEWIRGDLEKDKPGKLAIISDDIVLELPFSESGRTEEGYFRRYSGPVEVSGFIDAAFAMEKSAEIIDPQYFQADDGESVFVEAFGRVEMTSGRIYRNRYVMHFRVVDGKIVLLREYYNPIVSAIAFQRPIAGQVILDEA